LSIPKIFEKVDRPKTIKMKWRDTKGKPHIETISGFNARVLQHEIDHLDGILLTEIIG
jgi:peptide deformylase